MAAYATTVTLHRPRPTIIRAGHTHNLATLTGTINITNYNTPTTMTTAGGIVITTLFKTIYTAYGGVTSGATPCELRWVTYTGAATTGCFTAWSIITGLVAANDLTTIGAGTFIIFGRI